MKIFILTIITIVNLNALTMQIGKDQEYKDYFNRHLKLVSDSEIKIYNDSKKLTSNSRITGQFYINRNYNKNGIYNINCGIFQEIYKVVNECQFSIYGVNGVMFTKANRLEEMKNFNPTQSMIECEYNEQYGLMQDCQVKMYR